MNIDISSLPESIARCISEMDYVKAKKMPDIRLYMDQIVTYVEDMLADTRRYDDDKIMTKTMVNNYVKSGLLVAPEKKRYSKEHILALIFIYYFKNVLSITDIETMFKPVNENFFESTEGCSLEDIYETVFSLEHSQLDMINDSIQKEFLSANEAVAALDGLNEAQADFLQKFVFICLLNFDIYIKKQIIEKLVDSMSESPLIKKDEKKPKKKNTR